MIDFGEFVATLPPEDRNVAIKHQNEIEQLSEYVDYGFVFDDERWKEIGYDFYTAKRVADLAAKHLSSVRGTPSILEIGAGSNENILRAITFGLKGIPFEYIVYNENKILSREFIERANVFTGSFLIREQDILKADSADKYDLVILQHAINDIAENHFAKAREIDTVEQSWWSSRSERFKLLNELVQSKNGLEQLAAVFAGLVDRLLVMIKPGGILLVNHCCFQNEVRDGYNRELNNQYIRYFRDVAARVDLLVEVDSGLNHQWWFLSQRR